MSARRRSARRRESPACGRSRRDRCRWSSADGSSGVVAGLCRLFADDAAGVGGVVAADIEEIADIVCVAALEDFGQFSGSGLSRLEPRAAEGVRARRASRSAAMSVRSTRPSSPPLTRPRTPWRMPSTRFTWLVAQRPRFRPSMTPTSDSLITAVGPPDWPITALPEGRSDMKPHPLCVVADTMPLACAIWQGRPASTALGLVPLFLVIARLDRAIQ